MKEIKVMLDTIAQSIYDKKGFNILGIDVRGISSLTDYFIIAEGNVDRHLSAISRQIIDSLKDKEERPTYVEASDNWIVIDYLSVVIHLFTPEFRDKYRLEEVWGEGSVVDLDIDTSRKSVGEDSDF